MQDNRKTAWALTLAGLIPFIGGAVVMALNADFETGDSVLYARAGRALMLYGAVILSFLGGIRWGAALSGDGAEGAVLTLSVVPSLAAWGLVFGDFYDLNWWVFASLGALFVLHYVWDRLSVGAEAGLPGWFLWPRLVATLGAAASLGVGAWASWQRLQSF
jgi:hypothetical protein